MKIRDYAVAMAAYNEWMNEKVYAVAAELSDAERKRDLGAFFKSVHLTLNHILIGDQAWMQRFRRQPLTVKALDEERYADFNALREARRATDEDIRSWAAELDESFGSADFAFFSVAYQKNHVIPGWAAVVHMFNHQTHHRGQVTTLLKQLGKDPGITDLPWMPFFEPPAG